MSKCIGSMCTLFKKASCLSSNFKNKTHTAKIRSVQKFIGSIGLCHIVSSHVVQKDHMKMEEESQHFILMMRNKVAKMDLDSVINMDQTPIPCSYHSLCTLEKKGVRTVMSSRQLRT